MTSAAPDRVQRLPFEVGGGRRFDHLDARGRGHGEVRRQQRHLRAAATSFGGDRDAHAARGAVAEEADGVDAARVCRPR